MKWTPGGDSQDVEDRRGDTGGGGGGFGFGGMHIGIGGAIILLILSFVFKTNFFAMLGGGGGSVEPAPSRVSQPNTPPGNSSRDQAEKPLVQFVSFVLDDTQKTWTAILPQQANKQYRHAKLVLFRDAIQSGCGGADAATGPFYCPEDEKVYIDLGFYDELRRRFGAPG
ncbi:MAG: neutral zinc metallopeptidase, partial [Candidatus Acidiferrum sp.]